MGYGAVDAFRALELRYRKKEGLLSLPSKGEFVLRLDLVISTAARKSIIIYYIVLYNIMLKMEGTHTSIPQQEMATEVFSLHTVSMWLKQMSAR